jgi:hypothetical protein
VLRWLRAAGGVFAWTTSALLTLWATAALYFDTRIPWLRWPLALAYTASMVVVFRRVKPRALAHAACAGSFALMLVWWFSIEPSNDRDWQPDVARLPYADIDGNQVTIHGIRNCLYRSEADFDVRYYDKTFDLEKLSGVDLFMVYWGSPLIAHTMMSFDFGGGDHVCFSIETRKEKGEAYSALRGFFRQFEITYVVADERDLVELRTSFRHEDVYLYRLRAPLAVVRGTFLDYLSTINALRARPQWYNALTSNCTSNIRDHVRPYAQGSSFDWRFVLNGHMDELLYERGRIGEAATFAESKAQAYVNPLAQAAGNSADFSARIRSGRPAAGR